MSDHEPSYYEIALTNRQVMVAFVILLSCLLGTFFAGVWVGRSEAEPREAAVTAERPVENGTGVRELDFFSGGALGGSDEEAAPPAGPAPALPDPVAARAEREARQPEPAPPQQAAEPEPGADLAGGEGAALDAGAPPAAREPERRAATPPPAARAEGPVIQVFSSRDRDQAERIVERLRNGGERPFLSPVEVDGQTMYRVRLGPFADREEATRVAERVRRGYGLDTWITAQ
ncbi:MAG TPA: SPOR domain-containing protein [Thermoanaerobaculia bacterium]